MLYFFSFQIQLQRRFLHPLFDTIIPLIIIIRCLLIIEVKPVNSPCIDLTTQPYEQMSHVMHGLSTDPPLFLNFSG